MRRTNKKLLLRAVQSRAARVAVGASTVRGAGNAGVAAASREFLAGVDLRPFGTPQAARFEKALEAETRRLQAHLPHRARKWGLARKVLNIFLRDCLYTGYLADAYSLGRAEHHMELPLDAITTRSLRDHSEPGELPPWLGVKRLTPTASARYQARATACAADLGFARVHLDSVWWSLARDEA